MIPFYRGFTTLDGRDLRDLALAPAAGFAQTDGQWFAGGIAGVAALSADGRHVLMMNDLAISQYKPETGLAGNVFVGKHLNDWVTVQANYMWNTNDLTLVSARTGSGNGAFYEQRRDSTQHALVGDLLVYFRASASAIRPYLSVGGGLLRLASAVRGATIAMGAGAPEADLTEHRPVLRVAVGLDVVTGPKWRVRYSFSESLSRNPISQQLMPPAQRRLANFQNLVGIVRTF